jgi:hypothetical protein
LAGFVPGIAETFSLSAGRSRLAGLQSIERAAAPTGVIDALYAIRVLRNARLSPRRAGDAEADRRKQQRARQLDAITYSCGERRTDHSRSHTGNPPAHCRQVIRVQEETGYAISAQGLSVWPASDACMSSTGKMKPTAPAGRRSGTLIPPYPRYSACGSLVAVLIFFSGK